MARGRQWLSIFFTLLLIGVLFLPVSGLAEVVKEPTTSSALSSSSSVSSISAIESSTATSSSDNLRGKSDQSSVTATSKGARDSSLPISFGMTPVSRQPINFNGTDVTVPVLMDLPRTGTVNFYVMFWWGINQWVGSQTFTKTGQKIAANFIIPASVIPQEGSIHTVSLFAVDSSDHQTGLTNLIMLSNVSGVQNGDLRVIAPGNVTFNQDQKPLTVNQAWGHQLLANIVGPQLNNQTGIGDNRLAVLDTYKAKQSWTLTASAAKPLTGPDHETLTGALYYARNGKHQPIEGTQALVATSNDYASEDVSDANQVVQGRQTNISGHWGPQTGLYLEVPYGVGGGNEVYSGAITWTLTDGVTNQ
ncbi:MAG TPA: hypothetical protein DCW31_09055 [Lactobacillus sp.]|nr:hypothetical protein [Lactobacillus sp.]